MTLRAYKFRFYPTSEQAEMLAQTFGCVRFVYNHALNFANTQYQLGVKTKYQDWSADFPAGLSLIQGGDGTGKTSLLRLFAGESAPQALRAPKHPMNL